jgi:hypothetical protein
VPVKVSFMTSPGANVVRAGGAAWLARAALLTLVWHPVQSHMIKPLKTIAWKRREVLMDRVMDFLY